MKRNKTILCGLLLMVRSVACSQDSVYISYKTFLKAVTDNNPVSERARNIEQIGDEIRRSARGLYDPVVSGSYENKFFNGLNYYSQGSALLKQPLFTSQYLKAGYDYGYGPFINGQEYTGPGGLSYLGIEAGLLQGLLFDKRRAELLKGREYKKIYEQEKNNLMNEILLYGSAAYFEWLYLEEQLRIYDYFVKLSADRNAGIAEMVLIGERAVIDSVESSMLVQTRMADRQSFEINRQKKRNELLQFLWKDEEVPYSTESFFYTNDSIDGYFMKARQFFALIGNIKTESNPVLKQYTFKQNVLNIETRLKKEMIKPRLDVSYNFFLNDAGQNVFSYNRYKWGASVSFPLFLRSAIRDYQVAKLNAVNNNLELSNKRNEMETKTDALKKNALTLLEQVDLAETAVKYSRLMADAELLRFDNGESSIFMVNARESKWIETELKYLEYKHKFIQTVLGIVALQGLQQYSME